MLIDANLLLLLIMGGVDGGRFIPRSKRLGRFCKEDFDILWKLAGGYQDICITPYIAAEVSNLIDLNGYARCKAFALAQVFFGECVQPYSQIAEDCRSPTFIRFGLTDSSIIGLSRDHDVLTTDARMLVPLYAMGGDRVIPYIPVRERGKQIG